MADLTTDILAKLADIESRYGVRILFAVESGSRAWGIASRDSDWDVRFIYARPRDAYLQLWPGRDVIEETDGDLDLAGWDVDKALRLAAGSNPAIIEWLQSASRYRSDEEFTARLYDIMAGYSPRALIFHYASLADRQRKAYLQGDEPVRLKKYLYAVRPLLAVKWMALHQWRRPPIEFDALYSETAGDVELREAIDQLLVMKRDGTEGSTGRFPALDMFVTEGIADARSLAERAPATQPDREMIQALFMDTVNLRAPTTAPERTPPTHTP